MRDFKQNYYEYSIVKMTNIQKLCLKDNVFRPFHENGVLFAIGDAAIRFSSYIITYY